MRWRLLGFWPCGIFVLLQACSGTEATPEACAFEESGAVVVGAGELEFRSVGIGEDVVLERGAQGGCHLAIAVRTTGLPGRRVTVQYTVDDLDTEERALTSRQDARLRAVTDGTGACEAPGIRAILARPWDLEDHRFRVDAMVTDERDRAFEGGFEGVIRWPAPVDGVDRDLLCGPRD